MQVKLLVRLHLQSLALTNPHRAHVVDYGTFSLWIIHKEGLCPSCGDINKLMVMMMVGCMGKIRNQFLQTSLETQKL
jgi:hypothetical protein